VAVERVWTRTAGTVALVGFGVYASLILVTHPGDSVNHFATMWLYQGLIAFSVVIAAVRAMFVKRDRVAWIVITIGLASNSFAELYTIAVRPENYPSLADAGWLGFYPLLYAGVVLLIRRRARTRSGTLWLDGLVASVAAAALGAAVLVELVLQTTEGSTAAVATNLAYPLGDVLLLSAVFGVFSLTGWRLERFWVVLALGVLATTVADAIYLFEVDTYQEGTALDLLWPASTLLIAGSAWVKRREQGLALEGRPLLAVPAVCTAISTGVLVYDHFQRVNLLAIILATATLVFVVVRLGATFRENTRLFALTHDEAITDALTGLFNRRKLMFDLDGRLADEHPVPTLVMLFDLDGFKGYNDTFGHPAGDALLARLGGKLATVSGEHGAAYRLGGDEFCLIATASPAEVERVIDQACLALSERGEGFDVSTSFGAVMLPDEAADASEALRLADERLYAQKRSRSAEGDRTMNALLDALTEREPELLPHLEGVVALAAETGRMLGLRRDELHELAKAAELHDLGKLAVPDEILHKRGALDEREWEFIHQHTVVGERILRASPAYQNVATIVRSSHERWDGSGYPDGLAGEAIPLASRIICVCDAYDAMISERPYRPALTPEDALAEIERCSGTMFDPTVARVLVAHVRDRLEAERAA
jgi:two-component system, cell cycle response regulator